MKNFPLITKYIDEIGIDVDQSERLFLSILEANLLDVENGRYTVDDAVGEAYDFYAEAMDNSHDDY
jgi:tryptophan synthase beta subunit